MYAKKSYGKHRGGATPLSQRAAGPAQQEVGENLTGYEISKGLGGIGLVKILRYYGTKIVRINISHSKATQYSCVRREPVILNLFQDLNKIRSRNESGMTEVSCHPEGEALRISLLKRFFAGAQNYKNTFLVPYCLSNLVSLKKAAFTLAEVLITLAIIGVVAAMTIPTLISNYQEKATVSKVKQAFSIISQAYQLAKIENGEFGTWGFKGASSYDKDDDGQNFLCAGII